MESNASLINVAGRLEKFMTAQPKGNLKQSITSQVSAAIYYQAHVMAKLMNNEAFNNKFKEVIFNQLNKDFSEYLDAKARSNPKTLHHVYEWDMAGSPEGRLFKLNRSSTGTTSFSLSYEFLPSKSFTKTGNRRHVFINKASVMEAGMPLKIAPRFAERLIFESNGRTIYMPKGASVIVNKPGGEGVKKSFETSFRYFFSGNLARLSIQNSGFERMFNNAMDKSLSLPFDIRTVRYTYSPNTLRHQAGFAVTVAFGSAL